MQRNLLPVICYLLSVICHLFSATCLAAIPEDYYSSIDGKTGDAITEALYNKINSHTDVGYDGLWTVYNESDVYPGTKQVWDIYSTCNFQSGQKQCGNYDHVCDCQNREHTVPQSWFSGSHMKSDAFHVMPTDGKVNGQRSNYPYGECSKGESAGVNALGKLGYSSFAGYSGRVFEPDDEFKGDIARNYFYMVTCYRNSSFTQTGEGRVMFTNVSGHAALTSYSINLLLKWHRQDPVSQKEIDRNEAVYKHQRNRNPFIDYPCLAEYIWGKYQSSPINLSSLVPSSDPDFKDDPTGCFCKGSLPAVLDPAQGQTISVGAASVGESVSHQLEIKAQALTKPLSLALSGTNASFFSLSKSSVSAEDAMQGDRVLITYTPTAKGTHSATLTISSSELKSSRTITLTASSATALIQPLAGSEYTFTAYGIGSPTTHTLHVKATNLTSAVSLTCSGPNASFFTVSPASLTAAQANQGADVLVSFCPTKMGAASAQLNITSDATEFSPVAVSLQASCDFQVLPATNVTRESATLNWTNAGVSSYLVDVYIVTAEPVPADTILSDYKGSNASSCVNTKSFQRYIQLGSATAVGEIAYSSLNLSNGGQVIITARAATDCTNAQMQVSINSQSQAFKLSEKYADYQFSVPAGSTSPLTLTIASQTANQMVWVRQVSVVAEGREEERTQVQGYPRKENYLTHTVSGLLPETEYTYTITPEGLTTSEPATFFTVVQSDLPSSGLHTTPCTKILRDGQIFFQYNNRCYTILGQSVNH